jgi:hypothetical protein
MIRIYVSPPPTFFLKTFRGNPSERNAGFRRNGTLSSASTTRFTPAFSGWVGAGAATGSFDAGVSDIAFSFFFYIDRDFTLEGSTFVSLGELQKAIHAQDFGSGRAFSLL